MCAMVCVIIGFCGHCLLAHTFSVFPVKQQEYSRKVSDFHIEGHKCVIKHKLRHEVFFRCFDHLGFFIVHALTLLSKLSALFFLLNRKISETQLILKNKNIL